MHPPYANDSTGSEAVKGFIFPPLPGERRDGLLILNKRDYSLYATKVACTAGKKKATLFLGRIGSGGTRYQSKRRAAVMKKNYRL
ncbi:MAG TPA: hypothetical protein VKF36_18700, partial [Syntrophorhabdales bacterium]|nr:hypothetical protein [Syntrophorhabdales bacterium]